MTDGHHHHYEAKSQLEHKKYPIGVYTAVWALYLDSLPPQHKQRHVVQVALHDILVVGEPIVTLLYY